MNTEKNLAPTPPATPAPPLSASTHAGTENCLPPGTWLQDFEITGVLGEGGFGIVYLAIDHALQRTVAIKEYMPGTLAGRAPDGSVGVRAERQRATFAAGLKSFINEARLLAQFDHPALVKVYRFWEANQTAYMAMRHYHGQTLKDIIQNRPELISEAWLKLIFKPILEALDTLSTSKILHRDVSPDNIIVQKDGSAVLLDFGSARQIIGDMTQGLTVILKPGYAPVEQYSDDGSVQQGPWTDIYALAAVMYFAIRKTPPPISIARIVTDSFTPLQPDDAPGYSAKFLMAVNQGLALQPQQRPQSMDEFRRLLGISAFVSTRVLRSASAVLGQQAMDETDDVLRLADIKNAPHTGNPQLSTRPHSQPQSQPQSDRQTAPQTGRAQASKPGTHAKALAAILALLLIALTTYFVLRPNNPKPGVPEPAQLSQQKPNEEPPNVKVLVKPWGTVFVDGIQMGASPPLKTLSLSEGRHKIRITNPGFPDFVSEIDVHKNKLTLVSHEFNLNPKSK